MPQFEARSYTFADYRMDLGRASLWRGAEELKLRPKAFDVLRYLIEHRGQVVKKDELLAQVWPDAAVTEDALVQCLVEIRRALGESDRHFIRTVPRRGYLFDADVASTASEPQDPHTTTRIDAIGIVIDQEARIETHVASAPGMASYQKTRRTRAGVLLVIAVCVAAVAAAIAIVRRIPPSGGGSAPAVVVVLPFRPVQSGPRDEYLELGMADALIGKLSHVRQIIVRPTSTVRRYTAIDQDPFAVARELGANSVVDGSIQRQGDRIRVTIQLSSVPDRQALWAGTFDELYTDIFEVQDTVSERVARALVPRLSRAEERGLLKRQTGNTEAYHLYLKGRYFWERRTEADLNKALEFFAQAIRIDPSYALAYAGLAHCYGPLGHLDFMPPEQARSNMRAAAVKAVELDDSLAEAHTALGALYGFHEWDWPAAERAFKRAIELDPNYPTAYIWYGFFLQSHGRAEEGLAVRQRAIELDPVGVNTNMALGMALLSVGRLDEAIIQTQRALELDAGFSQAHTNLGVAYWLKGEHSRAIAEFEQGDIGWLGYAHAAAGNRREAVGVLEELKKRAQTHYVSPLNFAIMHAALGNKDEAFIWLERAYQTKVPALHLMRVDLRLASLRGDPRFAALRDRMKLPAS